MFYHVRPDLLCWLTILVTVFLSVRRNPSHHFPNEVTTELPTSDRVIIIRDRITVAEFGLKIKTPPQGHPL